MLSLRLLFKNLDGLWRYFLTIAVFSVLDGFASFLIPVVLAKVAPSASLEDAPRLTMLLIGLFFSSLGCQWVLRRHAEVLGPKFSIRLRRRYFGALEALPFGRLRSVHSAYLVSLINRVADGLGGVLTRILWGWIRSLIALGLFIYFSAEESPSLALCNAVIIIGFTLASTVLSRRMVPKLSRLNEKNSRLFAAYADFAANAATVKMLGIRAFADKMLDSAGGEAEAELARAQSFHALRWFLLHSLYGITFLSTLAFLVYKALSGAGSPAPLILFVAAFAVLRTHAEAISEDFRSIIEIEAALKPLDDLCPLDLNHPHHRGVRDFESLELKGLVFRHADSGSSLRIPYAAIGRGEKILITGESGAGKSTLLGIISGLLTPESGETLINGAAQAVPPDLCAAASQDAELFSMSIFDNICLGQELGRDEVSKALGEVNLLDWLKDLPQGLDTEVGERGAKVSAGQRQRINLVRACLMDRPVYLLDEPTSNLDPETEGAVVRFIKTRLADKTVVIVSHRQVFGGFVDKHYSVEHSVVKPHD